MQKRSMALFAALVFCLGGIATKLVRVIREPTFSASETRSSVTVSVATARGTIYDRQLKKLTNNSYRYAASVLAVPEAMSALADTLPSEEWEALQEQLTSGKPIAISSQTPLPLTTGIRQFIIPNRYTDTQAATHLIGYVEGISGVCGIEKAFDDILREATGSITVTYQTDGRGNALPGGETTVSNTLSRADAGVALTIDLDIQRMTETVVGAAISKGAAVIMNPSTGDIVAMASFPNYQPTCVVEYLERSDAPLFDRALAVYNCGSVFKTVSALAAIESGIPITQEYSCVGAMTVGNNRIKCHHVLGHGTLNMSDGYARSCNPYFIQLIRDIGAAPLYRMASILGFDSPIPLATGYTTARAIMPSEQDMQQETSLANLSFGQGELLASPVHIAQMTSCVVNGGVIYRPNVYYGSVDAQGNVTVSEKDPPVRVCSSQAADALRTMMIGVTEEGTGTAAKPRVGSAGGKTGTAQTGWVGDDGDTMVQNWFTGFYPANDPQYVITLLAEDSGRTGETTASVFARLCDQLYCMGYVDI